MGVRAEKMKGLFVYSFSEQDAEINDNCLAVFSKSKDKYFFVFHIYFCVAYSVPHLGLRARGLMGN